MEGEGHACQRMKISKSNEWGTPCSLKFDLFICKCGCTDQKKINVHMIEAAHRNWRGPPSQAKPNEAAIKKLKLTSKICILVFSTSKKESAVSAIHFKFELFSPFRVLILTIFGLSPLSTPSILKEVIINDRRRLEQLGVCRVSVSLLVGWCMSPSWRF